MLSNLDYVPLAITLVAKLARNIPLQKLNTMWEENKTSMLFQGKIPGRLTSVDYSIGLSVDLLTESESTLLSIICFLPDGVPDWLSILPQILPRFEGRDQSVNTLLEHSLVLSKEHSIKVLAPIREYIQKRFDIKTDDLTLLERSYITWLKKLPKDEKELQDQVQPHIMNITKILDVQTRSSPKQLHIEAIEILSPLSKFYSFLLKGIDNLVNNYSALQEDKRFELKLARIKMLRWLAMFDEAEDDINKAIKSSMASNSLQINAMCLYQLGELRKKQNKYNEAVQTFLEAESQFEKSNEKKRATDCLCNVGEIYALQNRYNEASKVLLTKALSQFELAEDQLGVAQCLRSLGDIHLAQDKYSEANEMLTKAQYHFELIGSQLGAAQCLRSLGDIHRMQGRYSEANKILTNAQSRFELIGDQLGAAQCLKSLGQIHQTQGRYNEASEILTKAHFQFELNGSQLGAAQCLRSLGNIYRMQKRYSEASEMLTRAQSQFELVGYRLGAAQCLQSLGITNQMQGRYSEAGEMFTKAQSQFRVIGSQLGATQCLRSTGRVFQLQGRYNEAIELLTKAQSQFELIGDHQEAAESLFFLAQTYRGQALYKQAKVTLDNALATFEKAGNRAYDVGWCYYEYGLVHKDAGEKAEATGKFEEAKAVFARHGELEEDVDRCSRALAELNELQITVDGPI